MGTSWRKKSASNPRSPRIQRQSPDGPRARVTAGRRCNLCSKAFAPRNRFERICESCKSDSDLYRFYEIWPDLHSLA